MAAVIIAILLSSCLSSLSSSAGAFTLAPKSNVTVNQYTFTSNGYTIGSEPTSNNIISKSSDGPYQCGIKCSLDSNCASWMVKNNECFLNTKGTSNVIAGYKVNNYWYFSGSPESIIETGTFTTPDKCIQKCDALEGCVAWRFDDDKKICEFLKNDPSKPLISVRMP